MLNTRNSSFILWVHSVENNFEYKSIQIRWHNMLCKRHNMLCHHISIQLKTVRSYWEIGFHHDGYWFERSIANVSPRLTSRQEKTPKNIFYALWMCSTLNYPFGIRLKWPNPIHKCGATTLSASADQIHIYIYIYIYKKYIGQTDDQTNQSPSYRGVRLAKSHCTQSSAI